MKVELDKECENCGTKFQQYVSFSKDNERVTIKVYRYKCPFCGATIKEPTAEDIKKATIAKNAVRACKHQRECSAYANQSG